MAELHCTVVTPEETTVDKTASFVVLPLFDGEIGIAPGHTPMIGRLGSGEMRIRQADKMERYYVEGGFVEVLNNVVSVLTGRAIAAEQLDVPVAEEQLQTARSRPASTPELMAQRDEQVDRSRALLRVARRASQ